MISTGYLGHATASVTKRMPGEELSVLNNGLHALGELPAEVWHEWLWGSDPEEAYHMDVLLNRNHLLGLLICRHKHLNSSEMGASFGAGSRMTIMDKSVATMSWRELKDTVANVLIEWPAFLDRLNQNIRAKQNLRQVGLKALDALETTYNHHEMTCWLESF